MNSKEDQSNDSDAGAPTKYEVRIDWLMWRPPWRRSVRAWATDVTVPAALLRRIGMEPGSAIGWLLGVVASVCVLLVAVLALAADALATAGSFIVSLLGHFVLRRPYLIFATATDGKWRGWWVQGWRRARALRRMSEVITSHGGITAFEDHMMRESDGST